MFGDLSLKFYNLQISRMSNFDIFFNEVLKLSCTIFFVFVSTQNTQIYFDNDSLREVLKKETRETNVRHDMMMETVESFFDSIFLGCL